MNLTGENGEFIDNACYQAALEYILNNLENFSYINNYIDIIHFIKDALHLDVLLKNYTFTHTNGDIKTLIKYCKNQNLKESEHVLTTYFNDNRIKSKNEAINCATLISDAMLTILHNIQAQ